MTSRGGCAPSRTSRTFCRSRICTPAERAPSARTPIRSARWKNLKGPRPTARGPAARVPAAWGPSGSNPSGSGPPGSRSSRTTRLPVSPSQSSIASAEAIELTRACAELGVAGTLHVTPYYNKPTQEGLVAHFTAIADAVDLPIVLYNVPSRTSCDMAPETVATLARHRNIVGIKEATGDMHKAARIRELCPPPFAVLSGDDFSLLPFLSLGCDGVISVVSNVIPGELARLCAAARDGRMDEARALHFRQLALSRALFTVVNPIPVKAALAMLGLCGPAIRLPLVPLDPASAHGRAVAEALRTLAIEA